MNNINHILNLISVIGLIIGLYFLVRGSIFMENSSHWLMYKEPVKWKWYYNLFVFGKEKKLFEKF
jgi:hypothetical protein